MPNFCSFNFYILNYVCVFEMITKFQNTKMHIFEMHDIFKFHAEMVA